MKITSEIKMTPENRTKYLCLALGWQGGTIHQLVEVTGCSVQELLYGEFPTKEDHNACMSFMAGSFWDTNSKQHQDNVLIPGAKGNLFFWLGVARKMEILEINCNSVYNNIYAAHPYGII